MSDGLLVLAATPIGQIEDASSRLKDLFEQADVIAAEDTRRFAKLLSRLGVSTGAKVVSYFDGNEKQRTPGLLTELLDGKTVALVTDAGMPAVSDPGYRLVRQAVSHGIKVSVIPGPSAVLTALAISGLPVDRFCFEGFLPRKSGQRLTRLASLSAETRTMVFFESPHRLKDFLVDCANVFGPNRKAVVCRELTKIHEEVIRGELSELVAWATGEVLGECTIVVAGISPSEEESRKAGEALNLVRDLIAGGKKFSAAVSEAAQMIGVGRKELYSSALTARKEWEK